MQEGMSSESSSAEVENNDGARSPRLRARIHVYPRKEILDPRGKAIGEALARLGFSDAVEVRAGQCFELEIAAADEPAALQRLREMCERLLANTVTEDYGVELLSSPCRSEEA